jgi:hypothetical protein
MANVAISQGLGVSTPALHGAVFDMVDGHTVVRQDVQGVVKRALSAARAAGRDYVGQTEAAARAVAAVRPDLSLQDAVWAVNWLRDHN